MFSEAFGEKLAKLFPYSSVKLTEETKMSSDLVGFPSLQPAFVMKVNVGEGNPVGTYTPFSPPSQLPSSY
jgi:hypothetical protein